MALLQSPYVALLPPYPTHLAVRWVHLLAMAALFGGAVLLWLALRSEGAYGVNDVAVGGGQGVAGADERETTPAPLRLAAAYERLFWAGAGLLVLTGVGNLGAMAPAIPGPGTPWGTTFSTKLLGVLGLIVGSLVRTVGVVGLLSRAPARLAPVAVERLRIGYAATAVYLLLVVLLAEVLAHG